MKYKNDDGSLFSKEEFLQKLKTDKEFNNEFGNKGIDQISELIKQIKENPDSRRLQVNAWAVHDLPNMVLPPCHYGFQVYTRELSLDEREWQLEKTNCINDIENDRIIYGHDWEKYIEEQYEGIQSSQGISIPTRAISLMWNQRSVDTFLGLPFNIASYGLLLEILAKEVNMAPDELIGNLGDVHLYSNHIEQAKEQIGRYFTPEERVEVLKQAMGEENYNKAVDELMPFGGGMSEYFAKYNISPGLHTRIPFPLPKINFNSEWWDKPFFELVMNDNFCKCLLEEDIQLYDYQSHPTIKAPLSN